MGQLFLNENATVTYCHSKTQNMKELTKLADILIVAVGRPKMVTADYIKRRSSCNRRWCKPFRNRKLCGDVDFDNVLDVAGYITPVPKGVGPMTMQCFFIILLNRLSVQVSFVNNLSRL